MFEARVLEWLYLIEIGEVDFNFLHQVYCSKSWLLCFGLSKDRDLASSDKFKTDN